MKLLSIIWNSHDYLARGWNKVIISPMKRSLFKKCGKKVLIGRRFRAIGWNHISVGSHVSIGEDCRFMTTIASIIIGDHVMFAPGVFVTSGGHQIDNPNCYMDEITDSNKKPDDDKDVVFEGDNWIGANAIILKGVTIGKGAVIGAGAIVTKNVKPYSIVVGPAASVLRNRFCKTNITETN